MTSIPDVIAAGPTVSFEFFPPKTAEGRRQLDQCIAELAVVEPSFVSVTYGAGGSSRRETRDLVVGIDGDWPFPAMPHLTCIGQTEAELVSMLDDYAASGIDNVLALAGDPPVDGTQAIGDFTYASELVELIRSRGHCSVAVAAFPECHPRSSSRADDRRYLAEKLSAADFGITQFFFSASAYSSMIDDLDRLGCTTPVLPGIMPLLNPEVVRRFAVMNHASFPEELAQRITEASPDDAVAIAVDAATQLCADLLEMGVPGLHMYCLNRSAAALEILERVGLGTKRSTELPTL